MQLDKKLSTMYAAVYALEHYTNILEQRKQHCLELGFDSSSQTAMIYSTSIDMVATVIKDMRRLIKETLNEERLSTQGNQTLPELLPDESEAG